MNQAGAAVECHVTTLAADWCHAAMASHQPPHLTFSRQGCTTRSSSSRHSAASCCLARWASSSELAEPGSAATDCATSSAAQPERRLTSAARGWTSGMASCPSCSQTPRNPRLGRRIVEAPSPGRAIRNSALRTLRLRSFMHSTNVKPLLFAAWLVIVSVVALAIGITSFSNWLLVAAVAIVPPVVIRQFWRTGEQTTSEAIHQARS
jgi:hypothetical protein